jgi:hypothetical protein
MTLKQTPVREYNFSDAELKGISDGVLSAVQRDKAELAVRGITTEKINLVQAKINAFADMPSDVELVGDVSGDTGDKEKIAEVLRVQIRSVRSMAQNVFEKNPASFRSFGFDGMSMMTDEKLYFLGKRVLRKAKEFQADLSAEGLTEAMLEDIGVAISDLEKALIAIDRTGNSREIQTQARVNAGNDLYHDITKICTTAKDIWASRDEARYNDYVIHGTSAAGKPATGDPNTGVAVQVLDEATSAPLANAEVTTNKQNGTELTKSVKRTETDGRTAFTGIEAGENTYTVTMDNYITQSGNVVILAGAIASLIVRMKHI